MKLKTGGKSPRCAVTANKKRAALVHCKSAKLQHIAEPSTPMYCVSVDLLQTLRCHRAELGPRRHWAPATEVHKTRVQGADDYQWLEACKPVLITITEGMWL